MPRAGDWSESNVIRSATHACSGRPPAGVAIDSDEAFLHLLRAYRLSGGFARIAALPMADVGATVTSSATPDPGAIHFQWSDSLWLPRFQFEPAGFALLPGPAAVIGELHDVFNGWELANWLVNPNLWIGDRLPLDLLETGLDSVLGAARADRFIATG